VEAVYIETTIISYLVARQSRDEILAAHQAVTRDWWEQRAPFYRCITSAEVLREAALGEPKMARKRLEMLSPLPWIDIDTAVESMAGQIFATGIFPREMWADAIHLAAASISNCDYLLTWNCRHLANGHVIRQLQRQAVLHGWRLPTICTPLELMEA
jgi:hypothetical protein